MNDEYLKYGFYVSGIHRVLTPEQMQNPKVIRWIKNEATRKGIPFRQWLKFLDDYYRDAPIIFTRRRTRDGKWKEMYLPLERAFRGVDEHWFEDFCKEVPMDKLPRLPRREAKLRVWVLGCLLRAMRNTK